MLILKEIDKEARSAEKSPSPKRLSHSGESTDKTRALLICIGDMFKV